MTSEEEFAYFGNVIVGKGQQVMPTRQQVRKANRDKRKALKKTDREFLRNLRCEQRGHIYIPEENNAYVRGGHAKD